MRPRKRSRGDDTHMFFLLGFRVSCASIMVLVDSLCLILAGRSKMADSQLSQSSQFNQSDLPELLQQYYKRLFPYKYYYNWLSYGNGELNLIVVEFRCSHFISFL